MNENHLHTIEEDRISADEVYREIALLEPKPVAAFVPDDGTEQKQLFFMGEIRNPSHNYTRLAGLTPGEDKLKIDRCSAKFSKILNPNSTEFMAYSQYADRYAATQEMLRSAQDIHSDDPVVSNDARIRFMEINEHLYGTPDEATYRSLLSELASIPVSEKTVGVKAELLDLLPKSSASVERFVPSADTISKMQDISEYFYGGMLEHVPIDQDTFSPQEIADIFQEIIVDEFGEAAEGWNVVVVKAGSINVVASDKLIKIPEDRESATNSELRGLVAHEIGVHMLRSITGEDSDLPILKSGLSGYSDAEEGLGRVMEQAVNGKYVEAGVPYYLIAGLMHFDNKDFRDSYDIIWRMKYLQDVNDGKRADEESIRTAQDSAYKAVFRITRGTDSLPWFKDLAYYNGSSKIWRMFEESMGDYETFMMAFLGKADPTLDAHRHILLETKSL